MADNTCSLCATTAIQGSGVMGCATAMAHFTMPREFICAYRDCLSLQYVCVTEEPCLRVSGWTTRSTARCGGHDCHIGACSDVLWQGVYVSEALRSYEVEFVNDEVSSLFACLFSLSFHPFLAFSLSFLSLLRLFLWVLSMKRHTSTWPFYPRVWLSTQTLTHSCRPVIWWVVCSSTMRVAFCKVCACLSVASALDPAQCA